MNKDLTHQWATDLRANPDLQGRSNLETPDGKFCCLGRLCAIQGLVRIPSFFVDDAPQFVGPAGDQNSGDLPRSFAEEIGITAAGWLLSPGGTVLLGRGGNQICLAALNDDGAPFSQIADIISYNGGSLIAGYGEVA